MQIRQIGPAEQSDGTWSGTGLGTPPLAEQIGDRGDAGRVPFQRQGDGPSQRVGPVVVEELDQLSGRTADGFAALESAVQQGRSESNG